MHSVAILGSGMVSGVGLSAPASCAAIQAGISGFVETRFILDGDRLIGSPVPLENDCYGRERLLRMVVSAIAECLGELDRSRTADISLLLCVSEVDRPGRLSGMDQSFFVEVQRRLEYRFHSQSYLIDRGRIGGAHGVDYARRMIASGMRYCLVAGVDTYILAETLMALASQRRIQTAENSDGFIPGEAAAAVLLGPANTAPSGALACLSVGYGVEPGPIGSDAPLRGDGLVAAYQAALAEAGMTMGQLDYRIAGISGEQYGFKEAALALTRVLRERKESFDIWHPADCVGEVGAATAPLLLAVADMAARKAYAPGPGVLCHLGSDDGERAALVLTASAS